MANLDPSKMTEAELIAAIEQARHAEAVLHEPGFRDTVAGWSTHWGVRRDTGRARVEAMVAHGAMVQVDGHQKRNGSRGSVHLYPVTMYEYTARPKAKGKR